MQQSQFPARFLIYTVSRNVVPFTKTMIAMMTLIQDWLNQRFNVEKPRR